MYSNCTGCHRSTTFCMRYPDWRKKMWILAYSLFSNITVNKKNHVHPDMLSSKVIAFTQCMKNVNVAITSWVYELKNCTLSGQTSSLYDKLEEKKNSITTLPSGIKNISCWVLVSCNSIFMFLEKNITL